MILVYSQEDHDQMCSRPEYRARSKSTASNRLRAKVCARLSWGTKSLYSRQRRSDSFLLHFWRDLQPFPTKTLSIGLLSLQFHPQNPKNRHVSIRFSPGDDLLCCACACHSSPQCEQLQAGSTSKRTSDWRSILHWPCFKWIYFCWVWLQDERWLPWRSVVRSILLGQWIWGVCSNSQPFTLSTHWEDGIYVNAFASYYR